MVLTNEPMMLARVAASSLRIAPQAVAAMIADSAFCASLIVWSSGSLKLIGRLLSEARRHAIWRDHTPSRAVIDRPVDRLCDKRRCRPQLANAAARRAGLCEGRRTTIAARREAEREGFHLLPESVEGARIPGACPSTMSSARSILPMARSKVRWCIPLGFVT
jgi:hypothetical protein